MNTPSDTSKIRDPVCGMEINVSSAAATRDYEGESFYFCSSSCAQKFDADPARYARQTLEESHHRADSSEPEDCPKRGMGMERNAAYPAPTGKAIYTCPMHPQIEQDHPGDCPICGMPLEPKAGALEEDAEDRETKSLANKFLLGVILTVPLLFLSLGEMVPGLSIDHLVPVTVNKWIQLVLATVIVFWCGGIFFVRAWRSVVNQSLNMFTLIGVGVGAAYLYSAIATAFPGIFPDSFKHHEEIDLYFEAAAVITVLVLLGQWLEARARNQTGKAIQSLLGLAAKTVHRLTTAGGEEEVLTVTPSRCRQRAPRVRRFCGALGSAGMPLLRTDFASWHSRGRGERLRGCGRRG
jgi:P-type Cu+ transporter